MIAEKNCPTHLALVECYLAIHFKDIPCAVFFDPVGASLDAGVRRIGFKSGSRIESMIKLLDASNKETAHLVSGDIYIHQMSADRLCDFVNNLDEDQYGYVAAWNGSEFVTENT